jgi:hypothetical protein
MKAIIVCTEYKGVFFGYIKNDIQVTDNSIDLYNVRMCIQWRGLKSIFDLAIKGPTALCRVSPSLDCLQLAGKFTAIIPVTNTIAIAEWEKGYWNS